MSFKFVSSKKGYVLSMLVLTLSIVLFAYLELQLQSSTYEINQNYETHRIERIDSEMTYIENSVLPEVLKFSAFTALEEYLIIIDSNETIRQNSMHDYSYVYSILSELMIHGTYNGSPSLAMQGKTLPELMDFYVDFMNDSLKVDYDVEFEYGRIYEESPLQISVQFDVNHISSAQDIDLNIAHSSFVDISLPVSSLRDPQVLLYGESTASEPITFVGVTNFDSLDWSWTSFNDTYSQGFVTIFLHPDYKYSIGNSFLRSIVNSTSKGKYRDILTFLSFEYDRDSTPYDSRNFQSLHELKGSTIFLNHFNNESNSNNEAFYSYDLVVDPADNCTIQGVSGNSCIFTSLKPIQNFEMLNDTYLISFWFNYSSSQLILDSSAFEITTDIDTRTFNFSYYHSNGSLINAGVNITLQPNNWNNLMIHKINDTALDIMINGLPVFANPLDIKIKEISSLSIGNSQLDELLISNSSYTTSQIAPLIDLRRAVFLEYVDSLYTSGLLIDSNNEIYLNSSMDVDSNVDEFALEFWFKLDVGGKSTFINFTNDVSGDYFTVELDTNEINVSIKDGAQETYIYNQSLDVSDGFYKHVLIQKDDNDMLELYYNGFLVSNKTFLGSLSDYNQMKLLDKSNNAIGIFDEFIMYNKSLNQKEIEAHYFNFKSEAGSCCNYFKLYNSQTHTNVAQGPMAPISTYFLKNENYNISLQRAIGPKNSSYPQEAFWYGEQFDQCQVYVFDMIAYTNLSFVNFGVDLNCDELILKGIY